MRKTKDNRRYLRFGLIVLLIVFLLAFALVFIKMWERHHGRFPASDTAEEYLQYNDKEYALKDGIDTFLVMGLDKYAGAVSSDSYNNDQQADFLMLLVFDDASKKCSAIHINRDTMANVSVLGVAGNKIDTVTKQIALAHTHGNGKDVSCHNTADAVSSLLLGVKVNHYISLKMDSVAIINDLVGGVDVTVLDDFTGIDDTLIKGETVTLKGEHALNYVRSRYGLDDSTNNNRMNRQRQYIDALSDKLYQCIANDDEFIVEASLEMSDYIVSDRSITQLQELARKFTEYEFVGISSLEGETKMGEQFMEFYPDEDSVKKIVVELFYELKA